MTDFFDPHPVSVPLDKRLNQGCFCITLDRNELGHSLDKEAGESGFFKHLIADRPHLFSNLPVFLPEAALVEMSAIVGAIEATARLPGYRRSVLSWAPTISQVDHGPVGVLMGYDFHLNEDGPKLIEINTNAGGAFLNAHLARAQAACCADVKFQHHLTEEFDERIVAMFREEWRLQRGSSSLLTVAIVDDAPEAQYLYPEFILARQLLARHGIEAVIADPADFQYRDGVLLLAERPIDLVYNRLVDFTLAAPEHAALRAAYNAGSVVVTPSPHHHALLANKRNLTLLSDPAELDALGLSRDMRKRLAAIPRTLLVTPANADELWQSRKRLFFKPVSGHGSKAVYRGDKLTKGVWADIARGDYVAQEFALPGERIVEVDGERVSRKVDVRLYTYNAQPLLVAARVYQGQTTNLRTPGGGFAPVLIV